MSRTAVWTEERVDAHMQDFVARTAEVCPDARIRTRFDWVKENDLRDVSVLLCRHRARGFFWPGVSVLESP